MLTLIRSLVVISARHTQGQQVLTRECDLWNVNERVSFLVSCGISPNRAGHHFAAQPCQYLCKVSLQFQSTYVECPLSSSNFLGPLFKMYTRAKTAFMFLLQGLNNQHISGKSGTNTSLGMEGAVVTVEKSIMSRPKVSYCDALEQESFLGMGFLLLQSCLDGPYF